MENITDFMKQYDFITGFTKVNNDINGNPRYVTHFLNLISEVDKENLKHLGAASRITAMYELAVKKAKKIGGKRFNNKQYGGGIVFQSYNLDQLRKDIESII